MTFIDPLSRHLHRHAGQHGPVMLMYHAVQPGKGRPAWPWAVSMQRFLDQLDFLAAEGYATPTMAELVSEPEKYTGRVAVITFDDGYVDNLAACDALHARGMRASWFVVTGSIGQPPRWRPDGRPADRLLDATELRQMYAAGMEIGSHTVSHVHLPGLDDARLQHELTDSRTALGDLLGGPVSSFAYPYGTWDARCAHAVQAAGYAAACTTRTGWALRDKDPYRLRRLTIFNVDSLSTFARKLGIGDNAVDWGDLAKQSLRRMHAR